MTASKNTTASLNPQWILGFVDGEGCFFVGINKMKSMKCGFQILPDLTVVPHKRDIGILNKLKDYFGCGVVRKNNGDRWAYRVRGFQALSKTIIPFFDKYSLVTKKQQDYLLFREIIHMMGNKEHLDLPGINKIVHLRKKMNTKKYKHKAKSKAKKPKI